MKKYLFLLAMLLLASPAVGAQSSTGYYLRADCGTIPGPVDGSTVCTQTTDVNGRSKGHLYAYRGTSWVDVDTSGSGVPNASYITRTPDGTLTNETAMSTLATGLVKNTTGTGNPTIAVPGTDYVAPGGLAGTATALAANGSNCSAGNAPLGIDASGNAEGCFDVATQAELTAHANSTSAHSITSSNTPNVGVQRDATGSFAATNITAALIGNADTATALAANPTDCSADQFATTIAANGNLTCAQVAFSQVSGTSTVVKNDQANTYSTGLQNFAAATMRLPNANTLPATCAVGDIYFDADGTVGNNIFGCTSTNTWTLQGDGGGAGTGDITDVWGCTSGNCDALTAAAGDTFDAGSADSSKPATRSTSLPGTCAEGQMHQDTDSGGSETYICTAANTWTKLLAASDLTGTSGNITVTGTTFDLGATAVQTDQANTYTTGAQDFASATSLKVPTSAGAAPTASGLIAYDSTSNTLEAGVNGANKTVAFIDGNVATATALAANPTDCPTNQFAHTIAASGNLTCSQVAFSQLSGSTTSSQITTQDVVFAGTITPTQLTGNVNDYAPSGIATASVVRISSDASRTITGLTASVQGRIIILHNVGSQNIVLADESSSSTAGNRFALPISDVTMLPDTVALLQYDATSLRWRVAGGSAGAITGSGTTNNLSKFTSSTAIGNSSITDDGTTVGIGSGNTGTLNIGTIVARGTTSGAITIQPQAVAGTYNWNWPTSAGTAGLPLLSGGGSSTAQSYGILGFVGGGTNQNSWTASRCVQVNSAGTALESAAAACGSGGGGSAGFDAITTGTNTSAAMTVGSGASLTYTGTGTINATTVGGNQVGNVYLGKTVDPTSSNNTAGGYLTGDLWINTTANPDKVFLKTDESAGTAFWSCISCGVGDADYGDVSVSSGVWSIDAGVVTSTKMAAVNTRRVCDMAFGDASGSVLTNGQLGPQKRLCFIPAASTIVEMIVAADGGTPSIIVGANAAGSVSNIVSSALSTASSGGIACSKTSATTGIDGATTCSATLQNTSLAAGSYLEAVSGTAGGVAKLMTVHVVYTVN